ncbi:cryptochrome-1 [Lingula anatina]|uniref:Cryptochrome-1 n=1 Tax=Lingula anatina TaxID=7574 RepID=A0A1S3HIC9_LINAN|nr:cryptochrome-1 [Lingula anatina]XP_013384754.1 cryptochrome-1 [Lingula anatina]|eukprot:XP_013384752.1 cryptochrome-1 [Lingula anatina]
MGKQDKKEGVSIHWFRHGLRFHDNASLQEALKDVKECYLIFIFDGSVAGTDTAGYNRWRFLLECLEDLDNQLKELGGRLYTFQGDPVEILQKLFDEWGVTKLTFEQDPEPPWQKRDIAVKKLCREKNIECIEKVSHTLYNPQDILKANGGSPPLTYAMFCEVCKTLPAPERPQPVPSFSGVSLPVANDFSKFELPTLNDFGITPECSEQKKKKTPPYLGGESRGLDLLELRRMQEKTSYKAGFILPHYVNPDLSGPPLSMSPHLRFGCVSVRRFYYTILDTFREVYKDHEQSNELLTAQLMWREYFYVMSVNNSNFTKMVNNPICLQIDFNWDHEVVRKWEKGQTGYPWIDACMRQLVQEGWLHQVGRHAVSVFLTRGDAWQHWEMGLQVFFKYLLDADWSVCAGNWMWVSSSAFEKCLDCPKCFHPVRYGQRMDPVGDYVRRYVPELSQFPLRYLFHPWRAPLEVQKKAGCIIGKDYPAPIVNHAEAAMKNGERMSLVREKYAKLPDIPHVKPSNDEEVWRIAWLPRNLTSVPCVSSDKCDALDIDNLDGLSM